MTADARTLPDWLAPLAAAAGTGGMAPADLDRFAPPADAAVRASAVLIALAEGPDGPDVLLIARAATLRDHAGQVAFPGGGVDPGDADAAATALRESREETGLDPAGVAVLATLPTVYVPRSRFAVTPVLAWWHTPGPVGVLDPDEVAAVARVPLTTLTDPSVRATVVGPAGYRGPCFALPGMFAWGFTAALLDRLLTVGGLSRPWDAARELPLPASVAGGWGTPHERPDEGLRP